MRNQQHRDFPRDDGIDQLEKLLALKIETSPISLIHASTGSPLTWQNSERCFR